MIGTLKQIMRDIESGVTDLTDNGNCTGCGECCTCLLPVSDTELNRIRRYVKSNHIKPQPVGAVYAKPMLDLTCPFLRKDVSKDRCMIYPVRPDICAKFKCSNTRNGMRYEGDLSNKRLVNIREEFEGK